MKKTYTLFHTDLRPGANKDFPTTADIRTLTPEQIKGAWSILYIRPDAKRFYLKNIEPFKKKKMTRFDILKKDSGIKKSDKIEFV